MESETLISPRSNSKDDMLAEDYPQVQDKAMAEMRWKMDGRKGQLEDGLDCVTNAGEMLRYDDEGDLMLKGLLLEEDG